MASKTVETIFRFVNDRAAANDVLRDTERIDAALDGQRESVERLEDAYSQMEHTARRVSQAERESADARIRAARESADVYGDVAGRTAALAGAASNLSPVLGQRLMLAGDILDATEAAKLMHAQMPKMISQMAAAAGGMGTLTATMGLAAVATAALYVGYEMLADANEEAAQKMRDHITVLERLSELQTHKKNTDQLQEEIAKLDETITTRQRLIDQMSAEEEEITNTLNQSAMGWKALAEELGIKETGVDELREKLEELNPLQAQDIALRDELIAELEAETTAVNDRLAAGEAAIQELGDAADYELALRQKVADYTVEQVDAEMAALERQQIVREHQLAGLQAALDAGTISQQQFDAEAAVLNGELNQMAIEMADLNTLVRDAAEARAGEAEQVEREIRSFTTIGDGIKAIGTPILAAVETLKKGAEMVAKYEQDRAALEADTQTRIVDLNTATRERLTDAQTSFNEAQTARARELADKIAGIQTESNDKIAEMQADFAAESSDRLDRYNRERTRAEEDHRDTLMDAAASLDAWGVLKAQRDFAKEQRRAEEDFNDETRQREDEQRKRLDDERKAADKRIQQARDADRKAEASQREALDRQLAQIRTDHERQVAEVRKAGADRLAALTTAHDNELRQLTGFQADEVSARGEHYSTLLTQLKQFAQQASAAIAKTPAATTSSKPTSRTSGSAGRTSRLPGTLVPYADGGYTVEGPAWLDPGEWVADARTTRLLERGVGGPLTQGNVQRIATTTNSTSLGPVHIAISGAGDPSAVARAVRQELMHIIRS